MADENDREAQVVDTSKVEMVSDIVSAYVSHNTIGVTEISGLIATVYETLHGIESGAAPDEGPSEPAVSVRSSIRPDSIACLGCGKRYKSLKRHLRTSHGLTPDEYRAKWGLKRDYPMVAPEYAEARSTLARQMGLGQKN